MPNLHTLGRGSDKSIWNPTSWIPGIKGLWQAYNLKNTLTRHLNRRGFFAGESLEQKIEELLRRAPDVPQDITPPNEPLRFRHFAELMKENRAGSYRPPLLLTATNLSQGRLEIISSVDERYMNVPVAKAVRASAGFPVFFTPREIPEGPDGGWFVDGGMVSNFPLWTFSDAFRKEIQDSSLYRHLTPKPWIRIGLRVVDDVQAVPDLSNPWLFFRSFLSMLTGTARNELEEILSSMAARSLIIKQPRSTTNGPTGVLEVKQLDASRIDSMVTRGYEYADKALECLGFPRIYSNSEQVEGHVRTELEILVSRCLLILGQPQAEVNLRANVFIPIEDTMKLLFHYNMENDGDRDMEFPDLQSGLTGFCYTSRRPQVCNLLKIIELRAQRPDEYNELFGMPPHLQGQVRQDRSWLASVPVFDPYELHFAAPSRLHAGSSEHKGKAYHGMETEMDGAVLGVLNLDAGWDYAKMDIDPDPDLHFDNTKVQAIISLMQSTALSVARVLSEQFPEGGDTI